MPPGWPLLAAFAALLAAGPHMPKIADDLLPAVRFLGALQVVLAMAIGVEKLKNSGYSGLFDMNPTTDGTEAEITPPAAFSMIVPA